MSVLPFLKEKTRLFEVFPSEDLFSKDLRLLIKGAVQSGKSRILYSLILFLTFIDHHVIVLLRNYFGDYEQFHRGWQNFIQEFQNFSAGVSVPSTHFLGNITRQKSTGKLVRHEKLAADLRSGVGCLTIGLSNGDHVQKFLDCWTSASDSDSSLSLLIDEVDQVFYTQGRVLKPLLEELVEKSTHTIGISATLYEPLHDDLDFFRGSLIMKPPKNYRGIDSISFRFIEPLEKKTSRDRDLSQFIKRLQHQPLPLLPTGDSHPLIALIKTERLLKKQDVLLEWIASHKSFQEAFTVISYNGSFVKLYSTSLVGQPVRLVKKRGKQQGKSHLFPNGTIQSALQFLKNNGGVAKFPRILIISHGMVGRGINIVSTDFGWHCTHMFYRPSSRSNIPTLLQSMRLCGIFTDSIPLYCFLEKSVYENLYKGFLLQEDIFSRRGENGVEGLSAWLGQQVFYQEKIPKILKKKFGGIVTNDPSQDPGLPFQSLPAAVDDANTIEGVCLKKLEMWINHGLVGKMIRFLYDCDKPVSLVEFQEGVGYEGSEKKFRSNYDNGCGVKTHYGRLWMGSGSTSSVNKITLHPKIREFLTKNSLL